MIELKILIQYWQSKTQPHPPITSLNWHDVLQSTIYYLEQLTHLKEVTK